MKSSEQCHTGVGQHHVCMKPQPQWGGGGLKYRQTCVHTVTSHSRKDTAQVQIPSLATQQTLHAARLQQT